MKPIYTLVIIMILVGAVVSFTFYASDSDATYYVSLNRAIQLGQYDGSVTVGELKRHGDFGLGSEEQLAAELVLLDGVAYGIPSSGKAAVLSDRKSVPFAAVKFFKADQKVLIQKSLTIQELHTWIDSVVLHNAFAAIKISGMFSSVQTRSFVKQEKPYVPTEKADTVVFAATNVSGIIVGFVTPASAEVINSPHHHLHFIDQKKTTGGHLIDCIIKNGMIEIDYSRELIIALPDPSTQQSIDLNKRIGDK